MQSERTKNVPGECDNKSEKKTPSPKEQWKERLSRLSHEQQEHIAK